MTRRRQPRADGTRRLRRLPALRARRPRIPAPGIPGYGVPRYEPGRYDPPSWSSDLPAPTFSGPDGSTGGFRRPSGLLDREFDETGPVVEPDWWAYGSSDDPHYPLAARHGGGDRPGIRVGQRLRRRGRRQRHPSAPLPPRPAGVWDRLRPREDAHADDARDRRPARCSGAGRSTATRRRGQTSGPVGAHRSADDDDDEHRRAPTRPGRRRPALLGRRDRWPGGHRRARRGGRAPPPRPPRSPGRARRGTARRGAPGGHALAATHDGGVIRRHDDDALVHDEAFGEDIPVKPYDPRTGRARRKRSPLAVLVSLLVLGGLVFGIVIGGQKLLALINPASRDYTGQGTGEVQIRVQDGDTLSDIARTLVKRRRRRLHRPVRRRRRGQRGGGRHPAGRLRHAAADERPGGPRPAARPLGSTALPRSPCPRASPSSGRSRGSRSRPASRSRSSRPPRRTRLPSGCRPTPTARWRASSSRPPTTSSPTPRRPTSCGRWSRGASRCSTSCRSPRTERLSVRHQGQPRAGRGGLGGGHGQGRPGPGEPARRRHAAAAGHDGELRQRQGRDHDHRRGPRRTRRRTTPTCTRASRRGRSTTPARTRCARCSTPTPGDWRFFVVVDPDTGETRFAVDREEHQQNVLLFQQWLRDHPDG